MGVIHSAVPVPGIDRRLLFPLTSILSADTQRIRLGSLLATLFFVTVLATAMYHVGLPVITVLPWDMAIQWDGAWRIAQGQIPNVDFRAVVPPLTLELSALGMRSGAPSAACIAYGNLLLFVVLTSWAWFVGSRRLAPVYALFFAILVGVTVLAPRPLGDKITAIGYAMVYNRQGWAMLMIVAVAALMPVLPSMQRRPIAEGLAMGALLGLLAFSKLTFFGAGVAAVGLHALAERTAALRTLLAMCLSFATMLLLLHAFAGLSLQAYLHETAAIAQVYVEGKLKDILEIALKNADQLFIVAGLLVLCLRAHSLCVPTGWSKWRLGWAVAFLCAAAVALTATSAQRSDIPLPVVAGLLCLEWLRRATRVDNEATQSDLQPGYVFGAILLAPLLIGAQIGKDGFAIALAIRSHTASNADMISAQIESPALAPLRILKTPEVVSNIAPGQRASSYAEDLNDGIELLRQHVDDRTRIIALDFSNPFPFAMGLPPARAGSTSWLIGGSFTRAAYPSAELAFGDANVVMIPLYERNAATVTALREIYGDYLSKQFRLAGRTRRWELYERVAPPALERSSVRLGRQ